MSEFQTEAEAIAALTKEIDILNLEGVPHATIPPGHALKSLEHLLSAPTRIKASPRFTEAASFAEYFAEFAETGTRIFVDDSKYRFTSVFDCHAKDKPAHGDHSASLQMSLSHEWERWKTQDGIKMNRERFAHFLENNLQYITGEWSGAKLLEMCRSLKVRMRGDIDAEEVQSEGRRSLVFKTDAKVAGVQQGLETPFPELLTVNIRVFKNAKYYQLDCRLRWTASERNGVEFWFDLMDAEAVQEQAFNAIIDEVAELTQKRPIRGSYSGEYHK